MPGSRTSANALAPVLQKQDVHWHEPQDSAEALVLLMSSLDPAHSLHDVLACSRIARIDSMPQCSCMPAWHSEPFERGLFMELRTAGGVGAVSLEALIEENGVTVQCEADLKCPACGTAVLQTSTVSWRPVSDVFCIAIDRGAVAASAWGVARKDSRTVHIPPTLLISGQLWRLRSLLIHRGNVAQEGHYFTFVLDNDRCYCYDDSVVTEGEALPESVDREAVLLLFELQKHSLKILKKNHVQQMRWRPVLRRPVSSQ